VVVAAASDHEVVLRGKRCDSLVVVAVHLATEALDAPQARITQRGQPASPVISGIRVIADASSEHRFNARTCTHFGPNFSAQSDPSVGMCATTAFPPASLICVIASTMGSGLKAMLLHTSSRDHSE
jgi:hypothetical protein